MKESCTLYFNTFQRTKLYNYLLIHNDANSNDDITMETLENQITLETLDHLINKRCQRNTLQ